MTMTIKVNREYTGPEWRKYKTSFHKHVALRRDMKCSVIKPSIYATYFMVTTRNPSRCKLCLAIPMTRRIAANRTVLHVVQKVD